MGNPTLPPDTSETSSAAPQTRSKVPEASKQSKTRRTLLALLDQAVVSGTNFLVVAAVGRFCGVEELGFYALGFSLLILTLSIHEGLILMPYAVLRRGNSPEGTRELAGTALIMSVCFALAVIISLGIAGLIGLWSGLRDELWNVILAVSFTAPFALWRDLARRMELAELRVRHALTVDAVAAAVQLGCIAALMASDSLGASEAIVALGIGCGVAALAWVVLVRHRFQVKTSSFRQSLGRSMRLGGWITATRLATVAGNQTVPWLLAWRLGVSATGGFAAASSIVSISNPLLMGLGSIHLPEAVHDYKQGGLAALNRATYRITKIMGITALVFSIAVALAAAPILRFAYGTDFDQFAWVVVVLAGSSLVSVLGFGAETGLRILERPKFDFIAGLLMLIVTAAITFLLADHLGALGGAIGLLCGVLVATVVRRVAFTRVAPTVAKAAPLPLKVNG